MIASDAIDGEAAIQNNIKDTIFAEFFIKERKRSPFKTYRGKKIMR